MPRTTRSKACAVEEIHGPHHWDGGPETLHACPGVPASGAVIGPPVDGSGWVIPPELLDLRHAPLVADVRLLVEWVEEVHSSDDDKICAVATRVAGSLPDPVPAHAASDLDELGVVVSFRFPVEWFDSMKVFDGDRTPQWVLAGLANRPATATALDALLAHARAAVAAMPPRGYQPTDEQVDTFTARTGLDRDRAVEVLRAAAEVLPLGLEP